MATIESQPAASANYMALVLDIVASIRALRSKVIDLEPTLSYAIAWAGYEQRHASLVASLQKAWQRL
jgi:superoxide dismutase